VSHHRPDGLELKFRPLHNRHHPIVQNGDYTSDWGLQIAMNSSNPPADSSGNGHTLGTAYSTITYDITPAAVTPANTAIRAIVHLVSQPCYEDPYCATIPASGAVLTLTDFNTECWTSTACTTSTCKQLTAADVPKHRQGWRANLLRYSQRLHGEQLLPQQHHVREVTAA